MSAEVPVKFAQVGTHKIPLVDPLAVQPVIAELIVENRLHGGIAYISLASLVATGDGQPEAWVSARLRLPLETVANLHQVFANMLANVEETKKSAN